MYTAVGTHGSLTIEHNSQMVKDGTEIAKKCFSKKLRKRTSSVSSSCFLTMSRAVFTLSESECKKST